MPGFTSECSSGLHTQCASRECRCACHPWTQELLREPVKKSDPQGGIRRLGKTLQDLVAPIPSIIPENELRNTCPKCAGVFKPTDVYCRRDGTRLLMGKQCFGCGAAQEQSDEFCWQCGLQAGEKPTEVLPPEEPQEDPIVRLQRTAREHGLLRETTV